MIIMRFYITTNYVRNTGILRMCITIKGVKNTHKTLFETFIASVLII